MHTCNKVRLATHSKVLSHKLSMDSGIFLLLAAGVCRKVLKHCLCISLLVILDGSLLSLSIPSWSLGVSKSIFIKIEGFYEVVTFILLCPYYHSAVVSKVYRFSSISSWTTSRLYL